MPTHYAYNANLFRGTVTFDNTKTAFIYFIKEDGTQHTFSKKPFVSLTIADNTNSPVFKRKWLKSGGNYIGAKVKFTSNYTGEVEWEVKE